MIPSQPCPSEIGFSTPDFEVIRDAALRAGETPPGYVFGAISLAAFWGAVVQNNGEDNPDILHGYLDPTTRKYDEIDFASMLDSQNGQIDEIDAERASAPSSLGAHLYDIQHHFPVAESQRPYIVAAADYYGHTPTGVITLGLGLRRHIFVSQDENRPYAYSDGILATDDTLHWVEVPLERRQD